MSMLIIKDPSPELLEWARKLAKKNSIQMEEVYVEPPTEADDNADAYITAGFVLGIVACLLFFVIYQSNL